MPNFASINNIFNGSDTFLGAAQKYTYDALIKEITSAVNNPTPPDIIYIGIGVGNPNNSYPSTNSTVNDKVGEYFYKLSVPLLF